MLELSNRSCMLRCWHLRRQK